MSEKPASCFQKTNNIGNPGNLEIKQDTQIRLMLNPQTISCYSFKDWQGKHILQIMP